MSRGNTASPRLLAKGCSSTPASSTSSTRSSSHWWLRWAFRCNLVLLGIEFEARENELDAEKGIIWKFSPILVEFEILQFNKELKIWRILKFWNYISKRRILLSSNWNSLKNYIHPFNCFILTHGYLASLLKTVFIFYFESDLIGFAFLKQVVFCSF